MSDYNKKYKKYKLKYLNLKKQKVMKGGTEYRYLSKFGSYGYQNGKFNSPMGITTLVNGNIAVCDSYNNCIQIFDSSGNFISKFGSKGSDDG